MMIAFLGWLSIAVIFSYVFRDYFIKEVVKEGKTMDIIETAIAYLISLLWPIFFCMMSSKVVCARIDKIGE